MKKNELYQKDGRIIRVLKVNDDKAFIIVSHVEEVSGNGFTYTKEMREA